MATQRVPRLEVEGVSKRYGAVRALDGVRLEVRPGEVMALLGENGAGKSTIVKVLSGLVRPDSGAVRVGGRTVELSSSAASQAAGIAVVQQEYSTVGALSVAENLVLGQRGVRPWWSGGFLRRRAGELLSRVGLGYLDPRTPAEELSVAELQLLEIARVLARSATVLILDEPTAALSQAEAARVLEIVRSLADEGTSILYITHRLDEVFSISDRVTIFRNGTSFAPAVTGELTPQEIVRRMLGRDLGEMFPGRGDTGGAPVRLKITGLTAPGVEAPVGLDIRRGQIVGLTGQVGAGGSALLRALAGFVPSLTGTVELDGARVDLGNRQAGIAAGIAYCSPDRKRDGIFAGLSIERNLSSAWLGQVARLGVVSRRREREVATRSARQFAIDAARLTSPVGTLSGGNQQKVVVGKWLGRAPRVLLVDEPTRGVDVGARAEIYRQLRALAYEGMAVVVCSSDTGEVYGLCDVIGTFHRGVLSSVRPGSEWTEEALVREVMHNGSSRLAPRNEEVLP
ncbi:sugar ABC transporter ATP-binding protein [Amycolatopsis pithecellobii]|uniref:ATP-binding cassette domain-containing protein n=1 Tax=Amycolatopsis pithecellobii TaxID=664692 RepID=A0A6N7Z2H2_9PSEU|nr:sugar ABC transporter ATP-binding protein [Amycolatopsis pithecellobii]MTD55109.1 ATP-binding cassette domain-containing protein [Amycolatopsis pithecellobii]